MNLEGASEIKKFINNYMYIKKSYETKFNESLNKEPYESIKFFPMKYCKYKVSIIIASWNSSKTLKLTLKTIENTYICKKFNDKLEVVVVDDGSSDDTYDMLIKSDYNFDLKYIKQVHSGRSQGINVGVTHSTGDLIIFCDADILFFPYTIDEIIKRQQEYLDEAIFFGFREDVFNPPEDVNSIEEYVQKYKPNFWNDNRFTWIFPGSWGSNMMLETNMLLNYDCKKNVWVSRDNCALYDCWQLYKMVYGFLFAVSRKNFIKIGGFAEFFVGWGYEDTLFIYLCLENDLKIIPVPSAHCLHIYHHERVNSQWIDAEKNKERMYNYILKKERINFLSEELEKRVITQFEKKSSKNKDILCENNSYIKNNKFSTIELANYYYYLGNLKKSLNNYIKIVDKLDIKNLENALDICIRLNDFNGYKIIISNNNQISECYFYYVALYFFENIVKKIDAKNNFKSHYFSYLNYVNINNLEERANQYYYEQQWYLSFLDYFGVYLVTSNQLDKCELVKQKYKMWLKKNNSFVE